MDLHILETIERGCLTLRQWNQMLVDLIYPKKLGLFRDSSARSLPPHWTGKWTKKKAIVAEMDGINHQNMGHWGDDCFTNMIHDWHFSQGLKDDIWSVFSEMFCLPGWWSGSIAGPPESTFFQPGFTTHHLAPLPVVSVLRQHQVGRLWACSMV